MEAPSPGFTSFGLLDALPVPAAVLDRDGGCRYLNPAGAADPVLACVRPGCGALDGVAGAAILHERSRRRHACCAHVLRTRCACIFDETPDAAAGPGTAAGTVAGAAEGPHVLWLCTPLLDAGGGATGVLLVRLDAGDWYRQLTAHLAQGFAEQLAEELQAPLTSVVSLVGSLAGELTGAQRQRAALIDRSGQQVLHRLRTLLRAMHADDGLPGAALDLAPDASPRQPAAEIS
jgi:hypothetical protein